MIKRFSKLGAPSIDARKTFVNFSASHVTSIQWTFRNGLKIIRRNAQPNVERAATPALRMIASPAHKADLSIQKIDTLTVHIGPKGGKYRLNSKGKDLPQRLKVTHILLIPKLILQRFRITRPFFINQEKLFSPAFAPACFDRAWQAKSGDCFLAFSQTKSLDILSMAQPKAICCIT